MSAPGPILALRTAILAALAADTILADLFGGSLRLHDEPPRGARPVYATFGRVVARDASGEGVRAHWQEAEIVVWSRPGSAAAGLAVADRIATLLDDSDLALVGHRLVRLRVAESGATRDAATGAARAWLRLAAFTETTS
ncbi:DUF3168 domain-containing protein [Salinarimonas ramus]|uniref:DUF3168 domain-containing protein n=1 Tax=Salinarimonas ramus TaxID=690164 RepID=A0A917V3E8_9HYPH|nr:DUF3168 domain-containing protein [Salinarimonas ramus]GGK29830.1 hypothetical protein GCM10011322_15340 [Salinarimonas ramus]